MDFDWIDAHFDLEALPRMEIEESFEDPFSIRLLPESALQGGRARYFNLGKSIAGNGVFTVFWTDGKKYRAILSRRMTPEELAFYDRKNSESGY